MKHFVFFLLGCLIGAPVLLVGLYVLLCGDEQEYRINTQ